MGNSDKKAYAMTVLCQPMEAYEHWRKLENLVMFSPYLISVTDLGDNRSTWKARGPKGDIEWQAVITADEPGQRIAWSSVEHSDVDNSGDIEFRQAPGDQGCEVYAHLQIDAPGGGFVEFLATSMGYKPEQMAADVLRGFKTMLECREIPTIAGQPSAQMRGEDVTRKGGMK